MKKPPALVFGALLMCARVASGAIVIAVVVGNWPAYVDSVVVDNQPGGPAPPGTAGLVLTIVVAGYAVVLLLYLALAFFVLAGRNWARVAGMAFATISILTAFADYWNGGAEITLRTTLLSLTLDILILLALSANPRRAPAAPD